MDRKRYQNAIFAKCTVENSYLKKNYILNGVFQKEKKYPPAILKMHRPQLKSCFFEWVDFYAVDQINTHYIGISE